MNIKKIRRRSNWYIYLITFFITGVIVYIIAQSLLGVFYATEGGTVSTGDHNDNAIFKPDESYNFTTLFMISENMSTTPDYYATMTYRADKNSLIFMPYLKSTYINGATLYDSYKNGGADEVMRSLSGAIGTQINKYVCFTSVSLIDFFDSVGNTTLSIPKEYRYENKSDKTLTIVEQGTHSFSGTQLYKYLSFPDYGEKDPQFSCKVHATALSAFINQNFVKISASDLDKYVNFIIDFTPTNIKKEDFEAKRAALVYTFSNSSSPCDYYIPYGEVSGTGYVVSENSFQTAKNMISVS